MAQTLRRLVDILPLLLATTAAALAAPAPTGSWSFEQPGDQVNDLSGNGLRGETPECERGTGHPGQALQPNGTTGLTVPH